MARDPDQTPVNPTDAQTVFEFIGRRLASGAPAGTKFDSVTTIGELHESIAQHFGPAGWTALASFWAEAAGLPQSKHLGERCLGPGEPSNAPQSPEVPAEGAIGAPVQPDLLDPAVLSTMPDRVAGWLRYQPRDPPPWVYQESAGEKADREFLQDEGAWTG